MRLSAKTLKRLIKGALTFVEERGYLTAYRYSKAQLEHMDKADYDWGWRMRGKFTGCVRIELKTSSTKIRFDYKATDSHPRSNTIDLYINKTLTSIYKIEDKLRGSVEFCLPEGEKLVSIYLPCESELSIKNFTIDGGYRALKDKGERLLIIGDSITQGAGADFSSAAYANVMVREGGYNIIAQGIGGYRFEPRDLMVVDGFDPDKILVFLGTNYYESLDYDYEGESARFFDKLIALYPNKPIFAITPLWRKNVDWTRFMWCIDKVKSACARHPEIKVIDGFKAVPCVDECFADGVHPNAYGSLLLARAIMEEIKK